MILMFGNLRDGCVGEMKISDVSGYDLTFRTASNLVAPLPLSKLSPLSILTSFPPKSPAPTTCILTDFRDDSLAHDPGHKHRRRLSSTLQLI